MENSFNIENVLAEIRQEVKEKGLELEVLPFHMVPVRNEGGLLRHFLNRYKERMLCTAYFKLYLRMPQRFRNTVKAVRRSLVGRRN